MQSRINWQRFEELARKAVPSLIFAVACYDGLVRQKFAEAAFGMGLAVFLKLDDVGNRIDELRTRLTKFVGKQNKSTLRVGDSIRLNGRAKEWTKGRVFAVTEIEHWGIVCSAEMAGSAGGRRTYHAPWEEIDWENS